MNAKPFLNKSYINSCPLAQNICVKQHSQTWQSSSPKTDSVFKCWGCFSSRVVLYPSTNGWSMICKNHQVNPYQQFCVNKVNRFFFLLIFYSFYCFHSINGLLLWSYFRGLCAFLWFTIDKMSLEICNGTFIALILLTCRLPSKWVEWNFHFWNWAAEQKVWETLTYK